MRVQIAARHCEIPDSVRERTEEQVARLTRYDPRLSAAEVVFKEEKRIRTVEVILSVDRDEPVIAHGEAGEFREALDRVIERLARMLRRRRDRIRDHQTRGAAQGVGTD